MIKALICSLLLITILSTSQQHELQKTTQPSFQSEIQKMKIALKQQGEQEDQINGIIDEIMAQLGKQQGMQFTFERIQSKGIKNNEQHQGYQTIIDQQNKDQIIRDDKIQQKSQNNEL